MTWNKIVAEYYEELYRFAYKFLGSREEAEDAVQETFLKAYRTKDSFDDTDSVRGWLYQITRNICIDRSRWWKRWGKTTGLESQEETADEIEESLVLLRNTVLRLPLRQREIFILRHWHGFSTEETAELLGLSSGTVKSHLKRAVEKMKKYLLKDKYLKR